MSPMVCLVDGSIRNENLQSLTFMTEKVQKAGQRFLKLDKTVQHVLEERSADTHLYHVSKDMWFRIKKLTLQVEGDYTEKWLQSLCAIQVALQAGDRRYHTIEPELLSISGKRFIAQTSLDAELHMSGNMVQTFEKSLLDLTLLDLAPTQEFQVFANISQKLVSPVTIRVSLLALVRRPVA